MTPDEVLRAMWTLCDSDDLDFTVHADQWWVFIATCKHGKFQGVSAGPLDIGTAFTNALPKFEEAHP